MSARTHNPPAAQEEPSYPITIRLREWFLIVITLAQLAFVYYCRSSFVARDEFEGYQRAKAVTAQALDQQVFSIQNTLARIDERLRIRDEKDAPLLTDHETRLRELERAARPKTR